MYLFVQFSVISAQWELHSLKFILFQLKEIRLFPLTLSESGWGREFETVNQFWKDAIRLLFEWTCIYVENAAVLSCSHEIMQNVDHAKKLIFY